MSDPREEDLFRSAVQSLKPQEAWWASQLRNVFGHPVTLTLDFDSLNGRFEMVQPFIHQGLTGVWDALGALRMDSAVRASLFPRVLHIQLGAPAPGEPSRATLRGGTLDIAVALSIGDVRAPTREIMNVLRAAVDLPPATEPPRDAIVTRPAAMQRYAELASLGGDPYEYAAEFGRTLEAAMRAEDLWPGEPPASGVEIRGAFGAGTISFEQWIAWIFIPRVKDIIATRGPFPASSSVAAYAVKQWDGLNVPHLVTLLSVFDEMVCGLGANTD